MRTHWFDNFGRGKDVDASSDIHQEADREFAEIFLRKSLCTIIRSLKGRLLAVGRRVEAYPDIPRTSPQPAGKSEHPSYDFSQDQDKGGRETFASSRPGPMCADDIEMLAQLAYMLFKERCDGTDCNLEQRLLSKSQSMPF